MCIWKKTETKQKQITVKKWELLVVCRTQPWVRLSTDTLRRTGLHHSVVHLSIHSILFHSRLCPSTAGSNCLPESSNYFCPLLSLSIPLPVAPQCHLTSDILVFQLILPFTCHAVLLMVRLLLSSCGWCVQPIFIWHWTCIWLCLSLSFLA